MRWWFERFGQFSVRFLGAALFLGALSAPALAANVNFTGAVGWSGDRATFVILTVDGIRNYDATGTSANLRVELWGGLQPFAGSFASEYRMATYDVGPVAAGAQTPRLVEVVPFTPPPPGSYYFAMVLTEYTGASSNDGYTLRSYLKFPGTTVIYGSSDTTPPTVGITSPTGGNVSGTVTISANASDNVGVTRVDFYVNGVLKGNDSAAPYQYLWNTTTLPNGTATLRAVAFDAKGNSTQSTLVTVTVANAPPTDTTPPTASITSPTGGNVSGTVAVSVNASDNVGVARVDLLVNGVVKASDTTAPYQLSWNTTTLANGSAQLKAIAYDAAGNSGPSAIVTVNVANAPPTDTTPPTASITSPTGGNVSGTVAVSVNANDNVGVARVDLLVNGVVKASDTTAPYQFSWNTTTVANGAAQLKAVAYDAAGNLAQSAIVTVNVANAAPPPSDTTPPTVRIASPTGGNVSGTVTISASASDNVGVARVDFYVNGTLKSSDNASPYQYVWNTTSLANGVVTLRALAFDAAGNSGLSPPVSVTVANIGTPQADYAVEYYNEALDHYFISASATDIAALDSGKFIGWARTGYAFKVYTQPQGTTNPVCRFYIPPGLGDSHFYSASPVECAVAVVKFPTFVEESDSVFHVNLPDPDSGACPANMGPVYRVWNGRHDSNHRYTTDISLRDEMVAKGYVAEGYGPDSVIMCAPM